MIAVDQPGVDVRRGCDRLEARLGDVADMALGRDPVEELALGARIDAGEPAISSDGRMISEKSDIAWISKLVIRLPFGGLRFRATAAGER